jgi:MFS family permease
MVSPVLLIGEVPLSPEPNNAIVNEYMVSAPEEAVAEQERLSPWLPLTGVIAAISVYAISQGLTYPLLSFILARQGHSPGMIGLSAAMTPIGFMCCAPFVPGIARRFGPAATVLASAFIGAAILAAIGASYSLVAWFPLRFMLGVAVLPLYIVSEVWIIELAPVALRGRVLGIYTSVISAGFALGPVALIVVGTEGFAPFLTGVMAFFACGITLLAVRRRLPGIDHSGEQASLRSFLPLAPVLLFAVYATAVLEQVSLSLLPVYGLAHGRSTATMSALIAGLIAGNIALQVPLGLAAERWPIRRVFAACAAVAAIGALLLPFTIETPLIWPAIFIWGAACFGLYTLALVDLGARYSGSMLVAGNAAFALMWGIGGITGPSATGAIMNVLGVEAMPVVLGLLCLVLAGAALRRYR